MRYRHRVTVQPFAEVTGSAGQTEWTPTGRPVTVSCNIHPLSTDEVEAWGERSRDMRTLFCRTWPGNQHSPIVWEGTVWDQVADAQTYGMGVATRHVEVLIRKR